MRLVSAVRSDVESRARHRALVADFFGSQFELPKLPESLPAPVPPWPWKERCDAD